jgi:pimeloyl-ACP methyl ester carboxylesterase
MDTVTSADGTTIAYQRTGTGPALILVDAALHHRGFSSFAGLVSLLTADFTVYDYDRRGRGDSGDTAPFAAAREVEDLAALIGAAGGEAFLYGFSSGALLALNAVAGGEAVSKVAVLEPPYGEDKAAERAFVEQLEALLAEGRRDDMLELFMGGAVPEEVLGEMRGGPTWDAMRAAAHTLVYDGLVSAATTAEVLAGVKVPALVLASEGSDESLGAMAAAVAAALPDATNRTLPGEWHGVDDIALATTLRDFFLG